MGSRTGISSRGYHPAVYGMQCSMALREQLAEERAQRAEKLMSNRKLTKSYWYGRLCNAMSTLKSVDPFGWEAWFDDDASVPEFSSQRNLALLVESRVTSLLAGRSYRRAAAKLYRGTFIWADPAGAFIFREDGQLAEFLDEAEARAYVDATLELCGSLLGALA